MKKYFILLTLMLLTLSPLLSGCGNSNEQVNKVVKSADQIALEEQAREESRLNYRIEDYLNTLLTPEHYLHFRQAKPSKKLEYIKNYFKKSIQGDLDYPIEHHWRRVYSERLAKQGNEEAQLNWAFLYYYGIVLPQDFEKSVYWFEQASSKKKKEHPVQSLYFLAQMYAKGEGVKQSYPKSIELYQILLKEMKGIQDDLKTENSDLEEKNF
jgi:hypothetical protein